MGAVGALSFGHGATAPGIPDGGAWGAEQPGAIAASEAGDALTPTRGFGGPLVDERSESGDGGRTRPTKAPAARHRLAATSSGANRLGPARVGSVGARLLGLSATPANAPPRS
jgi:hypothetical protein